MAKDRESHSKKLSKDSSDSDSDSGPDDRNPPPSKKNKSKDKAGPPMENGGPTLELGHNKKVGGHMAAAHNKTEKFECKECKKMLDGKREATHHAKEHRHNASGFDNQSSLNICTSKISNLHFVNKHNYIVSTC